MATARVVDLINEIQENHKQVSSSQKDEVRVMQAMLNDTSYEVGIYAKEGKVDTYNPAKDFRKMQSGIVSSVTKIGKDEAEKLIWIKERLEQGVEIFKQDFNIACEESFR